LATARFRFYEELNDFLPPDRQKVDFDHTFKNRASIKDMIESLGVPHTEVDLILVQGCSVDFSYIVQDGDRISVYPVFESLDISPLTALHPRPLRVSRFVLDTHLGRLARYLRMLGFDTLYRNDYTDAELARTSSAEGRILLTRDRGLLKRRIITHGYFVRETQPRRQLREILERLDLRGASRPFRRCTACNGLLAPVAKDRILARLKPDTRRHFNEFWICAGCSRIYWKGSHYEHMREFLHRLDLPRAREERPGDGNR
jgi:hypothetical protein